MAGLVFYGAVVLVVVLFMTGNPLPAAIALVVLFVVPLLVIACKEPLTQLLEKRKAHLEEGPVMFVVQSFFELFEVCLSYFSNTLSFVRIGAFAVSHAAMMGVVLMLAGAENGGTGNLVVIILGNIIVCGMEGLVVGIQVLRLEYYEFFSRFYKETEESLNLICNADGPKGVRPDSIKKQIIKERKKCRPKGGRQETGTNRGFVPKNGWRRSFMNQVPPFGRQNRRMK